jgi:hypothetical protein
VGISRPEACVEQDMGYKTVMVSLALDRSNDACLAVAGDLAERFEARVVGIAASDIRPTLYFAEGDYAQKVLEEEGAAVRKRLSELETEFRASVSKRAKSVERRSALTLPIPYVMQHARAGGRHRVGRPLPILCRRSARTARIDSAAGLGGLLYQRKAGAVARWAFELSQFRGRVFHASR